MSLHVPREPLYLEEDWLVCVVGIKANGVSKLVQYIGRWPWDELPEGTSFCCVQASGDRSFVIVRADQDEPVSVVLWYCTQQFIKEATALKSTAPAHRLPQLCLSHCILSPPA